MSVFDFLRGKNQGPTPLPPKADLSHLKRFVKIVVIDDEPDQIPIDKFRAWGYDIIYWPDVDTSNFEHLENNYFDIIILDVANVGIGLSPDEGLGVLKHIKEKNPKQIVILFSQHRYSLSKNNIIELADQTIDKPIDVLFLKRILDEIIEEKIQPDKYLEHLEWALDFKKIDAKKREEIRNIIMKGGSQKDKVGMEADLKKVVSGLDVAVKVLTLANKIIDIWPAK